MSLVFIGQIGSGKTTLFNKTTKSNEKTKSGGNSVTLNVFMKQSCYGQGFQVLDTPGFGSDQDKMEHVAGVLSALAEGPINKIVIVTKYNRTNLIIKDVGLNLPAFKNFLHMITVCVTFWDQCEKEEQQENKSAIIKRLNQIGINSVLFVGKNDTSESICSEMDQIIATSKAEIVNLTPKDIFENFDMSDFDELQVQEMENTKADSLTDYILFCKEAQKLINEPNVPEGQMADFFYALTQFAKQKLEENVKKFEKQLKQNFDLYTELKSYEIHNELKTALFKDYKNIIDLTCLKTSKGNHFSNYLKKCNYCNQIWLKVAGCTGLTACGRLLEDRQDEQIKYELPPQQFIVSYKNKKLSIIRDENAKLSQMKTKEEIELNLKRNQKNLNSIEVMKVGSETIQVGGIGCKQQIQWSTMIPLTEKELTDAQGILDEKMCNYINEQEKLYQERTQNQQAQYKQELEKKIQQQKEKMRKAK